jgi:hypothetical protein
MLMIEESFEWTDWLTHLLKDRDGMVADVVKLSSWPAKMTTFHRLALLKRWFKASAYMLVFPDCSSKFLCFHLRTKAM